MGAFIGQFIVIFIVTICIIEGFLYAYRSVNTLNRGKIRKKITRFSLIDSKKETPEILRKRVLSNVPILNEILLHIPGVQRLDRLIQQANLRYPPGVFILLAMLLALIGFYSSFFFTKSYAISIISGALLAVIPFFYLNLKKQQRIQKFEKQLPEGLEFIARALKAGHALTGSMKLAADNFDDPLGTEFERTLDEINFGVSITDALKNLINRVDYPDLKYFAVSVILQRETGGNLAEIMESIARVIRERFKFKDKIRVLSAEGRLSAVILISLPFLVIIYLQFFNPAYLTTLISESVGRVIAIISASMMLLGVLLMKKIINIKI